MTIQTLTTYKGDFGYDINFTVKDTTGTVVNLAGSTITLKVAPIDDLDTALFTGSVSIVSAAAGTCKYTVADGDFDTVGVFVGELQIAYGTSKTITAQNLEITVKEDVS